MTESPIDVWIKQAIPAGSGRYYALLHSKNPSQTSAVLTLISIWSKLCFSNREIDAAKKQVEWWQSELSGTDPRHPVTQQLHTSLAGNASSHTTIARLEEILDGYGTLVTQGSPSRETPNHQFHRRTGAVAALALSLPKTTQSAPNIEAVGIALSRFRCIRHLHKHAANGLMCMPYEEMESSKISPKDWVPGNYTSNMKSFLRSQLNSISVQLDESLPLLPAESPDDSFIFIYAQLQHRLLSKIQKEVQALDQADIRLSPLRNFWTAHSAARQHRKMCAAPD